jgi:hypothetical protein
MPRVGFEPMVPASARAKTVHALDRSAAVTGVTLLLLYFIFRRPYYKFSGYNLKVRIVAMIVIVDLQSIYRTQSVGTLTIYLHTRFHASTSSL